MLLSRRHLLSLFLLCCGLGLGVPFPLGYTYTDRLISRPPVYQIAVADQVARPPAVPRRTVVIVLDGLGYKEALTMRTASLLRQRGQCWKTHVGSLPMSRPVYAVLSTGVEQDRGGPLTNDATAPDVAESVWDIARAAGLSVAGVSNLGWWRDLFPHGFASYVVSPQSVDSFRLAPPADLVLIHTLEIDEMGHRKGAASPEYAAAVARYDRELSEFLPTLDLQRDLVLFTADHGHSLHGGHGGDQDRVANVLTCFAGAGVQKRPELGTLGMTSVGPALALLLGLHFPAHMRAGDDTLDALWDIADPGAFPASYLTNRRAAVERFRAANRAQLLRWQPASEGSWTAFYAAARRQRAAMALPFMGLLGALLLVHWRGQSLLTQGRAGRFAFLLGPLWVLACVLAAYALQTGLRGSFDMSAVNHRQGFIKFTVAIGAGVGVVASSVHLVMRRFLNAFLWDMSFLSLLGTLLCVAQPLVFGWHLEFPVPPPPAFFFPYFAALFLSALNATALLVCLAWSLGQRFRK